MKVYHVRKVQELPALPAMRAVYCLKAEIYILGCGTVQGTATFFFNSALHPLYYYIAQYCHIILTPNVRTLQFNDLLHSLVHSRRQVFEHSIGYTLPYTLNLQLKVFNCKRQRFFIDFSLHPSPNILDRAEVRRVSWPLKRDEVGTIFLQQLQCGLCPMNGGTILLKSPGIRST